MINFGSRGAHILEEDAGNKETNNKDGLLQIAMNAMKKIKP